MGANSSSRPGKPYQLLVLRGDAAPLFSSPLLLSVKELERVYKNMFKSTSSAFIVLTGSRGSASAWMAYSEVISVGCSSSGLLI